MRRSPRSSAPSSSFTAMPQRLEDQRRRMVTSSAADACAFHDAKQVANRSNRHRATRLVDRAGEPVGARQFAVLAQPALDSRLPSRSTASLPPWPGARWSMRMSSGVTSAVSSEKRKPRSGVSSCREETPRSSSTASTCDHPSIWSTRRSSRNDARSRWTRSPAEASLAAVAASASSSTSSPSRMPVGPISRSIASACPPPPTVPSTTQGTRPPPAELETLARRTGSWGTAGSPTRGSGAPRGRATREERGGAPRSAVSDERESPPIDFRPHPTGTPGTPQLSTGGNRSGPPQSSIPTNPAAPRWSAISCDLSRVARISPSKRSLLQISIARADTGDRDVTLQIRRARAGAAESESAPGHRAGTRRRSRPASGCTAWTSGWSCDIDSRGAPRWPGASARGRRARARGWSTGSRGSELARPAPEVPPGTPRYADPTLGVETCWMSTAGHVGSVASLRCRLRAAVPLIPTQPHRKAVLHPLPTACKQKSGVTHGIFLSFRVTTRCVWWCHSYPTRCWGLGSRPRGRRSETKTVPGGVRRRRGWRMRWPCTATTGVTTCRSRLPGGSVRSLAPGRPGRRGRPSGSPTCPRRGRSARSRPRART